MKKILSKLAASRLKLSDIASNAVVEATVGWNPYLRSALSEAAGEVASVLPLLPVYALASVPALKVPAILAATALAMHGDFHNLDANLERGMKNAKRILETTPGAGINAFEDMAVN